MLDEEQAAPETEADEQDVVEEQVEGEEGESPDTEAQAEPEGEKPEEEPEDEEVSEAKKRRERRKAKQAEAYRAKAEKERILRDRQKILDGIGEAPKEDDYEDPGEYQISKALWESKRGDREQDVERAKEEVEAANSAEIEEAVASFKEQCIEARGRYADFDQVLSSTNFTQSPAFMQTVMSCDAPADVTYHLYANNAEEGRRIASLPPVQQALEIGRIAAEVTRPKPKTQSSVTEPMKTVKPTAKPPRNLVEAAKSSDISAYRKMRMAES